jgi:hypothetical protein
VRNAYAQCTSDVSVMVLLSRVISTGRTEERSRQGSEETYVRSKRHIIVSELLSSLSMKSDLTVSASCHKLSAGRKDDKSAAES